MNAISRLGAFLGISILALAAAGVLLLSPGHAHRVATVAASAPRPPVPPAPASCGQTLQPFAAGGPGIAQHPDGSLTGCLRLGDLKPGTYDLLLLAPAPGAYPSQASPAAPLQVEPATGPPGTRVKLSAEVDPELAPATVSGYLDHTLACWGDCRIGITQWVALEWSASRRGAFEAWFLVPPVPYLGGDGAAHRVDPGTYEIRLPCLSKRQGKLGDPCTGVSLSAPFTVRTSSSPGCQDPRSCTWLRLSSNSAAPGDVVGLDGWAPIRSLWATGSLDPSTNAYYLGYSGQPQPPNWLQPLARVHFTVLPGLELNALGSLKPLWEQAGGEPALSVSADGTRLAYCASDGIRVSGDGGRSWSTAPTAGLAQVAAAAGLQAGRTAPGVPVCQSVLLDPSQPRTLYARFYANPLQGAPPIYSIGAVTRDLGSTWSPVPSPDPPNRPGFGGFQLDGGGVSALFAGFEPGPGAPTPKTSVLRTDDGGASWQPATLTCPAEGPCARLAADGEGSCAKGQSAQDLELSSDGGRTWAVAPGMGRLSTCSPLHLAALPGGVLALFSGGADPLEVSRDGGHTWHPVRLPENSQSRSIQILPDGSLLGNGLAPLLPPGSSGWCPAAVSAPVAVAAGRLWWRPPPTDATLVDGVMSIALDQVKCSG